jgi:hypothetical protein
MAEPSVRIECEALGSGQIVYGEKESADIVVRMKHLGDEEWKIVWRGTVHATAVSPEIAEALTDKAKVFLLVSHKAVKHLVSKADDEEHATLLVPRNGAFWAANGKIAKLDWIKPDPPTHVPAQATPRRRGGGAGA